jgi:hypothetical protein
VHTGHVRCASHVTNAVGFRPLELLSSGPAWMSGAHRTCTVQYPVHQYGRAWLLRALNAPAGDRWREVACRRTSQVIGPTCTCPCLKDLRQLCMCTKQLNRICPSAPRTPDKRLTAKIAGLSKHNSHTNTCSGNKFFITKWLHVTIILHYTIIGVITR